MALTIEPYRDAHHAQVVELVTSIQQAEFGIPITYAEQPDLQDPAKAYRGGCGEFWVALDGDRVTGCVALVDSGPGLASVRKMFVHRDYRGRAHGTAQRLLAHLLAHARAQGVRRVFLGTTEAFHAAHRFYERNGFVQVPREDVPKTVSFSHVDTRFYRLDLA